MDKIERLRGRTENDWSWQLRKKFIVFHFGGPNGRTIEMLNSYSWTLINSITLKCRYDQDHIANLNRMAKQADIYDQLHAPKPEPEPEIKLADRFRAKRQRKIVVTLS